MNELSLEDIKQRELRLLQFIDSFCREHGLHYSLSGGTLLGAVRHKGFIPWDDDIDLLMLRSDYDQFVSLLSEKSPSEIRLITYKNSPAYNYLFCKVCDTSTTLLEDHNKIVDELGVYIDVFPVDFLGNTYEEALRFFNKKKFFKCISIASNWRHFYINKAKSRARQIPRFFFYIISRGRNIKKGFARIEKEARSKPRSAFSGCLCGAYGKKEVMPTSVFDGFTEIEFEGNSFSCIKNFDAFLRHIYGDYMVLPPLEKRVTHHTFSAFEK